MYAFEEGDLEQVIALINNLGQIIPTHERPDHGAPISTLTLTIA